jgi:hypothetical protein
VGRSTTMTERPTRCQNIILVTYIPNGLHVLPDLLEFFVSAQNCALPTLSDLKKKKKHGLTPGANDLVMLTLHDLHMSQNGA